MKALFINENIGGHATVHQHLRNTIGAHPGIEVDFLDVPPRSGVRRLVGVRVPGLGRLDLDLQPLRAQLAASEWVRRRLAERIHAYDAVHIYTQNAALLSASLLAGVPSIVSLDTTSHENAARLPYRSPTRFTPLTVRASMPFEQRVFRSVDRIVANSRWAADSLRSNYAIDAGKLDVFPFGIVAPDFEGPAPGAGPVELPTIVFVGRQLERKGGLRLLRLHQRHLLGRARLVLITNEDVAPAPDVEVIRDLRQGDDRLWELLRAASVFVFPSTIDQAPNVVLEAMAAGLPVVAVRTAAIPEMVEHGVSGLLIDPADPDDVLLGSIEQLIGDVGQRLRFGRESRRRFEASYDAHVSTARLVSLLEEVTGDNVGDVEEKVG